MDIFKQFWDAYGMALIETAVTAIVGYIGFAIKKLLTKLANDRTKRDVARTCVNAIEQMCKDIHGEEKLGKCIEAISAMLMEKGISITELEIRMLIESSVKELNKAVNESLALEEAATAE